MTMAHGFVTVIQVNQCRMPRVTNNIQSSIMKDHQLKTSWQPVGKWYSELVDKSGHYYHEHVVIPRTVRMLHLKPGSSLLDLACGEGVLARSIPKDVEYVGVDIASSLIQFARKKDMNKLHQYVTADVSKPVSLPQKSFSHVAIILALQNIEDADGIIANTWANLQDNGILVIVLNHPCFRIPRQSAWGIDEQNKLQYRRINRYMNPLKIPITMHPGKETSAVTWTFHEPLSFYSDLLLKHHFVIERLEEWCSDKSSAGPAARMEDRARDEFPLFLALKARKVPKSLK